MDFLTKDLTSMGLADDDWSNDTSVGNLQGTYREVKWIQFSTALLSIIGSGSIVGYAVYQNAVRTPEVRPLFYLSVSNLLLALCWLIGAFMYKKSTNSTVACYNVQTIGQIFYASSFLYTLNYMWQLYNTVRTKLDSDLYKEADNKWYIRRIATVLSSVVPLLFAIPVLGAGNSNGCYGNSSYPHSCLVLNTGSPITNNLSNSTIAVCRGLHFYGTTVFLFVFSVTTLSILVILGSAYSLLKSQKCEEQQQIAITVTKRRLLLYSIVFFLCSIPAVILVLFKLASDEKKGDTQRVLYTIQAFTAVSQGLLNSLVYGWTQQMSRSLKQSSCRDMDTQTPLLSSQKRLYASTQTFTQITVPCNISNL